MRFAIFIDDLLGRKCIIPEQDLCGDPVEVFDADSWETALDRIDPPGESYSPALVCLPIHAAYITYIDDIDMMLIIGCDVKKTQTEGVSLIYDPLGMKKRKMLNREIREGSILTL